MPIVNQPPPSATAHTSYLAPATDAFDMDDLDAALAKADMHLGGASKPASSLNPTDSLTGDDELDEILKM
jgi:hypothetical protein